ncbi:MAG TPA: YceH family protein [Longimicrobiales bacterium]|nr:YceH family protein [Longimicrobiales bacterium]
MLDNPLDATAVRVLGALIEKEFTTPDAYPLTINALVAACNQTSNRDPVMQLDEATVTQTIADLTRRDLVHQVLKADMRAKRFRQVMSEKMHLHTAETAVMCVLMLRGPQTAGEIRSRTGRMHEFNELAQVELTLQGLMTLPAPIVVQLPRQPGQKDARYAHLLSGAPDIRTPEAHADRGIVAQSRLEKLEEEVEVIRQELAELKRRFDELMS